jgi:hypothetical protein
MTITTATQLEYEMRLCSFRREDRRDALGMLNQLLRLGHVAVVPEQPLVNLHSHTFYSYNAYGYSPSALAWEAKKRGLYAFGIMDHETLAGVEELLDACRLLGIRGLGGIETRVFVSEWSDREINMPGEPGVFGFLGSGFMSGAAPAGSDAQKLLARIASSARDRILSLIRKINERLVDIEINDEEVLSLVPPGGTATERHIALLLESKARSAFPDEAVQTAFWSGVLKLGEADVARALAVPGELALCIRSRLMKRGGPCYVPITKESYPSLRESIAMMRDLQAVPVAGWLDGMSRGEQDPRRLLELMAENNVPAISIIPDRNWNISDPPVRQRKIRNLHEILHESIRRKMIIVVGTDMSKHGQKFVDDFNAEPLKPFAEEFMKGAMILVGHVRLVESLGFGLLSDAVDERFRGDLDKRNAFFAKLGTYKAPENEHERSELRAVVKQIWEGPSNAKGPL